MRLPVVRLHHLMLPATGACLPFQAREERLDRPPETVACLPFQARGKAPDRPPV